MESKSSHQGHMMGAACDHLRGMHKENGHEAPAASGNKAVGGARQPMKAIKAMGKMGRKEE